MRNRVSASSSSSSLGTNQHIHESAPVTDDDVNLRDIFDILHRKHVKSKRSKDHIHKLYDRLKKKSINAEQMAKISDRVSQIDQIVDQTTYMKLEHGKHLLTEKANWQNDEDQIHVMEALHKTKALADELQSTLLSCSPGVPPGVNPLDSFTVGSRFLQTHQYTPEINEYTPTRFLVFDKEGNCLGNVNPPICMEANPVLRSHAGDQSEKDNFSKHVHEETRSNRSHKESILQHETDTSEESSSFASESSSKEDVELLHAIERLVQTVEQTTLQKCLASTQNSVQEANRRQSLRSEGISDISSELDEESMEDLKGSPRSNRKSVDTQDTGTKSGSRRTTLTNIEDGLESKSSRRTSRSTGNSVKPHNYHRGIWKERVPPLELNEGTDSEHYDELDVKYPGANALAMTALGRAAYGDSQWSVLEKKIRKMTHDAAMEQKISAGYVDEFTWDDNNKAKMGAENLPSITEILSNTGVGGRHLIRSSAWKKSKNSVPRRLYGGGGLQRVRANKFLTTGEMAYYHSQLSDEDQLNLVSVLLACRKLEKTLDEQNTVIDLLQRDLEQVRKTTFKNPDGLTPDNFVNLLDLDGPVPSDYFQLPECTAAFYSRLYSDPAAILSRNAASETEQRLRDAMKDSVTYAVHSPQIIHRKVNDVLGSGKESTQWQIGKSKVPPATKERVKGAEQKAEGHSLKSNMLPSTGLKPAGGATKLPPSAPKPPPVDPSTLRNKPPLAKLAPVSELSAVKSKLAVKKDVTSDTAKASAKSLAEPDRSESKSESTKTVTKLTALTEKAGGRPAENKSKPPVIKSVTKASDATPEDPKSSKTISLGKQLSDEPSELPSKPKKDAPKQVPAPPKLPEKAAKSTIPSPKESAKAAELSPTNDLKPLQKEAKPPLPSVKAPRTTSEPTAKPATVPKPPEKAAKPPEKAAKPPEKAAKPPEKAAKPPLPSAKAVTTTTEPTAKPSPGPKPPEETANPSQPSAKAPTMMTEPTATPSTEPKPPEKAAKPAEPSTKGPIKVTELTSAAEPKSVEKAAKPKPVEKAAKPKPVEKAAKPPVPSVKAPIKAAEPTAAPSAKPMPLEKSAKPPMPSAKSSIKEAGPASKPVTEPESEDKAALTSKLSAESPAKPQITVQPSVKPGISPKPASKPSLPGPSKSSGSPLKPPPTPKILIKAAAKGTGSLDTNPMSGGASEELFKSSTKALKPSPPPKIEPKALKSIKAAAKPPKSKT